MSSLPPGCAPSPAAPAAPAAPTARPQPLRMVLVRWIRQTHGWIGLWGALLGLVFGVAGVWLNHRAVLKLPMAQARVNAQLVLPDPAPDTPEAMARWLQDALRQGAGPNTVRQEPARAVPWTDKAGAPDGPTLRQPERWVFTFGGPNALVQADYWRGNRSVGVTTTSNGIAATLANLHKGTGMSVGWILLVDTLAGSMIFLTLSGVALWMLTHRRRRVGLAILGTSTVLTLGLVASRL